MPENIVPVTNFVLVNSINGIRQSLTAAPGTSLSDIRSQYNLAGSLSVRQASGNTIINDDYILTEGDMVIVTPAKATGSAN